MWVSGLQRFDKQPTYTEVNPGEDALMTCKVFNKRGTCSWQKDNKVSHYTELLHLRHILPSCKSTVFLHTTLSHCGQWLTILLRFSKVPESYLSQDTGFTYIFPGFLGFFANVRIMPEITTRPILSVSFPIHHHLPFQYQA